MNRTTTEVMKNNLAGSSTLLRTLTTCLYIPFVSTDRNTGSVFTTIHYNRN